MSEANQNLEVEVITMFQLLQSSYSVVERNILQTVLLQFLSQVLCSQRSAK